METEQFKEFKCIGDKCPITCCMEWKIAVDDDTYSRWKKTPSFKVSVARRDGMRVIALNNEHMCPYLCQSGLCSLVLKYGDEMLSSTCNIFPRQINDYGDYCEKTVDICCPHVIDLINDTGFDCEESTEPDEKMRLRNRLVRIMTDAKYTPDMAFLIGFYVLADAEDKNITDDHTIEQLFKMIGSMEFCNDDTRLENEELFQDICANYRKQGMYDSFFKKLSDKCNKHVNEYDNLLKNIIASEMYSNLYLPDYSMDDMFMAYEWILMEYCMMRYAISSLKEEHSYEAVRECIVIVARIMGYEIDDISEYIHNSFEEPHWDWGYAALLIGGGNLGEK